MERLSMIYDALLESYAEEIVEVAIKKFEIQQLYIRIDNALQNGDRMSFHSLTNELKSLN